MWSKVVHSGPKWSTGVQSGPHWSKVVQSGPKWSTLVQSGPERYKVLQSDPNQSKGVQSSPKGFKVLHQHIDMMVQNISHKRPQKHVKTVVIKIKCYDNLDLTEMYNYENTNETLSRYRQNHCIVSKFSVLNLHQRQSRA